MKESENTTITVLNNLFAPLARKRVKELGMGEAEEARYVGRIARDVDGVNNVNAVATGESLSLWLEDNLLTFIVCRLLC